MSRKQFRKNVRSFGIDGDDTAIDELFNSFDKEGRGSLDLDQLRAALTGQRETSIESDKEAARLKKEVDQLWKAAKAGQQERKKRQKAVEAEAKAKKEQAEVEAAEKARAAEEVAAAKDARTAAKKQKEAEDRAAYAEKIRERRKSMEL
jgi:hypothetical protein